MRLCTAVLRAHALLRFPACWQCLKQSATIVFSNSPDLVLPACTALCSCCCRYTLGGVYLARYDDSPAGAFEEVGAAHLSSSSSSCRMLGSAHTLCNAAAAASMLETAEHAAPQTRHLGSEPRSAATCSRVSADTPLPGHCSNATAQQPVALLSLLTAAPLLSFHPAAPPLPLPHRL